MIQVDKQLARSVLRSFVDAGCHSVTRGHIWFHTTLLPALRGTECHDTRNDRRLLSDCYYNVGDVYEFLGARRTALTSYKRAVAFDQSNGPAWRELGLQFEATGSRGEALKALDFAVARGAPLAKRDRAEVLASPRSEPACDALSASRDALAAGRMRVAFRLAQSALPSTDALLHIARIYGRHGQSDRYLRTWREIARARDGFTTTVADWFYLPCPVRCMPELLVCWQRCLQRWDIDGSVMPWGEIALARNETRTGYRRHFSKLLQAYV